MVDRTSFTRKRMILKFLKSTLLLLTVTAITKRLESGQSVEGTIEGRIPMYILRRLQGSFYRAFRGEGVRDKFFANCVKL